VGVDVDRAALAKAQELGITPVVADVEEPLPLESGTFDAVVAGELLEHIRFPHALVAEARRVLRPGGVFVGSVPNAFRLQNRLRFVLGRQPEKDPTHVHMFTPADLRALLAGLVAVRVTPLGGRYRRIHSRLLAQDLFFSALRPT
jgi:SAM-dependent methyltransferase